MLAPLLFVLYLQPLAHVIKKFGFGYHFYADDVQFYISIDERKNNNANVINECLKATKTWLSVNKLKVNCNKTQSIIFSRKHSTPASVLSHDCDCNILQPLSSVKNLGVILDCNLSMTDQINAVVKKCNFHICNIGKIRKYVNVETCKMLVNSLVLSQLDYCNALYSGLPNSLLSRLQKVQNTAARLTLRVKRSAHITPVLMELHWLPVEYRVKFKILLQTFKVVNDYSPSYLTSLLSKHVLLVYYVLAMLIYYPYHVHFQSLVIASSVSMSLVFGTLYHNISKMLAMFLNLRSF